MELATHPDNATQHAIFDGHGRSRGLRARMFHWAVGQFRRPHGVWGRVAGRIMATRPSNLERNRWSVELLDVQPADWVLEIGFGPGVALGWLHERAPQGLVVGIDHSELMLRQAAKRNAQAVRSGRMTLLLGSVESLPDLGTGYDRILAVNVVMFWPDPVAQLRELRERLRPGGCIALTVQPRRPGATDADARHIGEAMVEQLLAAGYRDVRLEVRPMRPVAAVCAIGHR